MSFAARSLRGKVITTNNISQLDKGVKDRCVLMEMNAATVAATIQQAAANK